MLGVMEPLLDDVLALRRTALHSRDGRWRLDARAFARVLIVELITELHHPDVLRVGERQRRVSRGRGSEDDHRALAGTLAVIDVEGLVQRADPECLDGLLDRLGVRDRLRKTCAQGVGYGPLPPPAAAPA